MKQSAWKQKLLHGVLQRTQERSASGGSAAAYLWIRRQSPGKEGHSVRAAVQHMPLPVTSAPGYVTFYWGPEKGAKSGPLIGYRRLDNGHWCFSTCISLKHRYPQPRLIPVLRPSLLPIEPFFPFDLFLSNTPLLNSHHPATQSPIPLYFRFPARNYRHNV